MDLSTTYLGLILAHPFMAGASPLVHDVSAARQLEDGGASALVLHSLFEEQLTLQSRGELRHRDPLDPRFASALAAYPDAAHYPLTPDAYLEHLHRVTSAVHIPVFASLNGTTSEAWMKVATELEAAGADGLEINLYDIVSDPDRSSLAVETDLRNMVRELKRLVRIPVAVKLSPYFTALGNLARRLDEAGVDGLVLFNRFYQPDIDLETLTLAPHLELSTAAELPLRLQWAALLRGHIRASIAVTGGVSVPTDGVKALLAGADAVQVVSTLLRKGPACFAEMRKGLEQFMDTRGFVRVEGLKGVASLAWAEDPAAFQRASYIRTLHGWKEHPVDMPLEATA